jgi:uncharacterized protein (TIRG00374 family)
MSKRKITLITIKLIITATLFFFIADNIEMDKTIEILKQASTLFLFFAISIQILQIFVANIRWHMILNFMSIHVKYFQLLRYLWIGLFFNQTLPSSVGGDAMRGYCLYNSQGCTISESTTVVLLDRFVGLLGLVFLILLLLPFSLYLLPDEDSKVVLVTVISLFFILTGIIFTLDVNPFVRRLIPQKFEVLFSFSRNSRGLMLSKNPGISMTVMSLCIHLLSIISVYLLSISMGLNIIWTDLLLIIPLVIFFVALPISIAGWGVREGVMVLGLGYLGVASEEALALSIVFGLSTLIISIPGSAIWLLESLNNSKLKK